LRGKALKVRKWITQLRSHFSWKRFLVFALAAAAIAGRSFLQEAVKHIVTWWSSDSPPALSYQITSVDRLTTHELSEYSRREFGGVFNLQLDDNIVRDYEIFKVRIRNDGAPIDHGFRVEALINDGFAKIIDLKHATRAPAHKSIPVNYSFPDLWWDTKKNRVKVTFSWRNPTNTEILGSFLYRSAYREFGYGKFNLGLVKRNCIGFDVKDLLPGYYAVVAVGRNGALSNLSAPIRFPESLALQPNFADVVWIDPSHNSEDKCHQSEPKTYSSLTEALAKEGSKRTFIIRGLRAESQSLLKQAAKLDYNTKLLFDEDLKFLAGKLELLFPEGFDSRGEIEFYFLTKGLPDGNRRFRLLLHGQPKLSFTIHGEDYGDPRNRRVPKLDAKKMSLTPRLITSLADKTGIIFIWPRVGDQKYRGVRVFRSRIEPGKPANELGEEVYDGSDAGGTLHCEAKDRPEKRIELQFPLYERLAPSEPPKRTRDIPKTGRLAPEAPTNLNIDVQGSEIGTSNFYADRTVEEKGKYKYTIYVYDDDEKYSYPIEIYASLDDELPGLDCRLEQLSSKKK
jgi:hypothetical protein